MIDALRRFVASVYSWKLNLILERNYYMSLQLTQLSEAVDKLTSTVQGYKDAVTAAQADRDKAVSALADAEATAAADKASDQAAIDALTAKLNGAA